MAGRGTTLGVFALLASGVLAAPAHGAAPLPTASTPALDPTGTVASLADATLPAEHAATATAIASIPDFSTSATIVDALVPVVEAQVAAVRPQVDAVQALPGAGAAPEAESPAIAHEPGGPTSSAPRADDVDATRLLIPMISAAPTEAAAPRPQASTSTRSADRSVDVQDAAVDPPRPSRVPARERVDLAPRRDLVANDGPHAPGGSTTSAGAGSAGGVSVLAMDADASAGSGIALAVLVGSIRPRDGPELGPGDRPG